jgi:hypothetical protein
MKTLRALLLAVAALAAACSSPYRFGSVSGEAFVVMASGEESNLAGQAIHLVPETASLDSALSQVCARRRQELAAMAGAVDTVRAREIADRAWATRAGILSARSVRAATTGPDAKFAMDSVPAGKYRVWADATVEGDRWSWMVPVDVRGRSKIHVALSNANADEDPFKCQR